MKTLLLATILISANLHAQTYDWTVGHAASSAFIASNGRQIYAIDSTSFYIVGEYRDTVDLDPSANVDIHTAVGSEDIFIQKYNADGTIIWTRVLDGTGRDAASEIIVTDNGGLYISGTFYNDIDLDPGVGTANFSFTGNSPYEANGFGQSLFLLKLDTDGNHQWSYGYGDGASFWGSRAVVNDQDNNIYTVASVHQRTGGPNSFDMDPSAGTDIIPCAGRTGILQKFDQNGNYIWGKRFFPIFGGSGVMDIEHVTSDLNSNIITGGFFRETVDFNPSPSVGDTVTGTGEYNIFIHKLDSSGSHQWVKSIQGTSASPSLKDIEKLATDNANNIYAVGYTRESIDMDPGVGTSTLTPGNFSSPFLLKLDENGDFIYSKTWGDTINVGLSDVFVDKLTNNVMVCGNFYATMDIDPGAGVVNVTSNGSTDAFVAELDSNGDLVWSYTAGGSSGESANSVFRTSDGATYIAGNFRDTVDFNPGGTGATLIAEGTSSNTFITRIGGASVGLQGSMNLSSINVYPNPAADFIKITGINLSDVVELIDINGKSVMTKISQGNSTVVDIQNYTSGNYYIKVSNDGYSYTSKVIIQ